MQVCSDKSLAYRSRYYHDIMAVNNLSKGEAYYKLPDSYVIFICFNLDKVDDLEEGKLKELMKYLANKPCNDDFVDILDKKISKIKNNDSLKIEYMFFNAELADERARGINQGIKQGTEKGTEQTKKEIVINLYNEGQKVDFIAKMVKLSINDVEEIIDKNKKLSI